MEPRQRSRPLTEQERRQADVGAYVERLMLAVRASRLFAGSEARRDGSGLEFTTTDRERLGASDRGAALGSRYTVRIEYGERSVEH